MVREEEVVLLFVVFYLLGEVIDLLLQPMAVLLQLQVLELQAVDVLFGFDHMLLEDFVFFFDFALFAGLVVELVLDFLELVDFLHEFPLGVEELVVLVLLALQLFGDFQTGDFQLGLRITDLLKFPLVVFLGLVHQPQQGLVLLLHHIVVLLQLVVGPGQILQFVFGIVQFLMIGLFFFADFLHLLDQLLGDLLQCSKRQHLEIKPLVETRFEFFFEIVEFHIN